MAQPKDVQQLTEGILQGLRDLGTEVERIDDRTRSSRSESPALAGVIDAIGGLRSLMPEVTEAVQEVAEGKIWIGVVGHYSHGKSSLLNALLQLPDAPELLPTGEGVVTGMVSRVSFSSNRSSHEFRLLKGAESIAISEEEYRAQVAGGASLTGVYAFDLELATRELAQGDLWEKMGQRRIALFDTPGLGGPYFSDANQVSHWMSQFLLLVVCVRADRITKDVATSLTPFLREAPRKILPVVTFWDTWRDCVDYEGIGGEEQARARAQQLLQAHFPILGEHAHRAVFVSARQYRKRIDPRGDESKFISPHWNIDQLRHALYQEMDPSVLGKVVQISPFERFRASRLHRQIETAEFQIKAAIDRFDKAEGGTTVGDAGPLEDSLREAMERIEEPYEKISGEIEDRVVAVCSEIGATMPVQEGIEEMARSVASCLQDFKRSHARSVKRELDSRLLRVLEAQLEGSGADRSRRAASLERYAREVRALTDAIMEADYERSVRLPGPGRLGGVTIGVVLKSMMNVGSNPNAWPPLLVCGGLLVVWPLLGTMKWAAEWVSEDVGKVFNVLGVLAILAAGVGFFAFFQGEWRRIRERTIGDFRKECRSAARRDSLCRALKDVLVQDRERFRDSVLRIGREIDDSADEVKDALRAFRERVRDAKLKLEAVSRLSRQLSERLR